jgi:NAD(P)-dependent dehydrogenase (short-subunit alcohol dehydrogenase family)
MTRTALITGGSRGIGFGIALELAKAGFKLAINGVREEAETRAALDEIRKLGTEVIYARGDISNRESRLSVLEQVLQKLGSVHVLVNNAGVAPLERRDLLEATEESFDRVMDINLKGPYFFTQLVARYMVDQVQKKKDFSACIINVSSISAKIASVNRGEYCLSKAGITMATSLWAVRLGEYNIPVYEIQPGIVQTDMTAGVREKYDRLINEGLCVQKRWGLPADVGKVAAAMAAGALPYSTGQVVMVDGGLTIPRL